MSADGSQNLPAARLVPKDGADRMAVLRGQVKHKAGRIAVTIAKVFAVVALLGAGVLIGGAKSRGSSSSSYDFDAMDRRMKGLQKMNDHIKSLQQRMQKGDVESYYRDLRRLQQGMPIHTPKPGASPSQATSSP